MERLVMADRKKEEEKKKHCSPLPKRRNLASKDFFFSSELNIFRQNATQRHCGSITGDGGLWGALKSSSPPPARPCEPPVVPGRPAGCSLQSPERPGLPARPGTSPI